MEDISGDQWEHFAEVSRNGPGIQDFSIQQHSPAHSQTAPLGPLCVCVPALMLRFMNVSDCSIRGFGEMAL